MPVSRTAPCKILFDQFAFEVMGSASKDPRTLAVFAVDAVFHYDEVTVRRVIVSFELFGIASCEELVEVNEDVGFFALNDVFFLHAARSTALRVAMTTVRVDAQGAIFFLIVVLVVIICKVYDVLTGEIVSEYRVELRLVFVDPRLTHLLIIIFYSHHFFILQAIISLIVIDFFKVPGEHGMANMFI